MIRLGKLEGALLFSFLALFLVSLLYVCRSFDHTTLASWQWVFRETGFPRALPFFAAAVLVSLLIAWRIPLEEFPVSVLVVTGLCSVLPLWTAPELMLDSARYFLQAKALSEHGISFFAREWGHSLTSWTDLPLIPFLYGLLLRLGDESRWVIQLYNTAVFILTLVLVYRTGKLLWDGELGLYAGLLLTGIPFLLVQVPQFLVDIHAMFFVVLALFCFIKALEADDRFSILLASASLVPAFFVKFSTWPLLALFPVATVTLHHRGRRAGAVRRGFFILLPAAGVTLVLFALKWEVFYAQIKLLVEYQRPALRLWGEGLASSFLFQSHPFIVLFSLLSLCRAYKSRDPRFLFLVSFCLLLIVLRIDRIRYAIPLLPFFALAAAYGLAWLEERMLRRLVVSLVVTFSLVIAWTVYLPFFQTTSMMNIKNAGAALDRLDARQVEVFVRPQERSEGSTFMAIPLLDLFTRKRIVSRQTWPEESPAHLSSLSPLLFTWKLTKPVYYELSRNPVGPRQTVVVISSSLQPDSSGFHPVIPRHQPAQRFVRHEDIYRYRTYLYLYR